jgi:hypothetical protein
MTKGDLVTPTTVEPLSRVEFEQLSPHEQEEHVQNTLTALRLSIPESGAAAGAFIDVRLYVQDLAGWAPSKVEALWPLHRAGIERHADDIHAAFQDALDSGSLSPAQAQFARNHLVAAARPIDLADEYI